MQSFLLSKGNPLFFQSKSFKALLTSAMFFFVPQASAQTVFTLEESLRLLPQSAAWRASDQAFLIAERSVNVARGAAGLSVTVGGEANRSQVSSADPALNGTAFTGSINAQASITVLPWSPTFDAVRAAERNLERARLDLLENRSNLQLQLFSQYLQVQLATTDVKLAMQNQNFAEQRLKITQAQLEARTATREAVLSAEATARSAQTNARAALNAQNLSIRGFFATIGLPPRDAVFSSVINAPKLEITENNLGNKIIQARATRSDVRRAILAVREAEDALTIAQRDRWLPNLGINASIAGVGADGRPTGTQVGANLNLGTGTIGVNGSYAPTTSNATATTISLQISIPLVAPSNDARIDTAQVSLNAAKLNLENAENTAALDIESKYYEYLAIAAQQEVAKANLSTAQRRTTDTQARLEAGLTNTLELEQAKLQEAQATREVQNASNQTVLAAYRLSSSLKPVELNKIP